MRPFSLRSHRATVGALLLALAACSDATRPEAPPAALSALQGAAASHTDVVLSWPNLPGAVREVRIERSTGGAAFAQLAVVAAGVLSYRDTGLGPATLYRYRVRACGDDGCSDYVTVSVTTNAQLAVTSEFLPNAVRGLAYTAAVTAAGGSGGRVWAVDSGTLPAGLALSEGGVLSGVPTEARVESLVLKVRSSDGQTAMRELTLTVVAVQAGDVVSIETSRLPPALAGARYRAELRSTGGGDATVWSVVGGSLPPGVQLGANGAFSGTPVSAGAFSPVVRASSDGSFADRLLPIVVVPHDLQRFNITQVELSPVPMRVRPHLDAAISRWEQVITGNLAMAEVPRGFFGSDPNRGFCAPFGQVLDGTAVDDVIIVVDIAPIDGPGKVLGQAGPCGLRTQSRLPFAGVLTLDEDDLEPMVGTQTLTDIIFHEIGHVLGFGVLWSDKNVLSGSGTSDPLFTGVQAAQAYLALGGIGAVPVEGSGGEGTRDAHWRESVFRREVMTGFSERIGVSMPLSRVTIASMGDLGYTVDFSAADAFVLPGLAPAPRVEAAHAPLGWDVILSGPFRYLPVDGEP